MEISRWSPPRGFKYAAESGTATPRLAPRKRSTIHFISSISSKGTIKFLLLGFIPSYLILQTAAQFLHPIWRTSVASNSTEFVHFKLCVRLFLFRPIYSLITAPPVAQLSFKLDLLYYQTLVLDPNHRRQFMAIELVSVHLKPQPAAFGAPVYIHIHPALTRCSNMGPT